MLHTTITSNRIKNIVLLLILCLPAVQLFAQDGVLIDYVGNSRESKAIFQINSTTQGAILPRMTAAQRGTLTPAVGTVKGLTVYQTDAPEGYYYWDGALWQYLASSTGSGYIQNLPVTNNFTTGQAASFDVTGNGEVSGTLSVGGNVGIGTFASAFPIDVYSTNDNLARFSGNDHSIVFINGTDGSEKSVSFTEANAEQWKIGMDNVNGIGGNTNDFIIKQTNNAAPEMVIQASSGNVGIGTTSPKADLDLGKTTASGALRAVLGRLSEGNTTGSGTFLGVRAWDTQSANYGGKMFSLESSFYGNLNSSIEFYRGGSTTGGFMTFTTNNGVEKMRIEAGGNVGIGTTAPGYKLAVAGSGHSFNVNPHGAGIDLYSTGNYAPHYQTNYSLYTGVPGGGTLRFNVDASGIVNVPSLAASSAVYTDGSKNLTSTPPTSGTLGFWDRDATNGEVYPATLTDGVGIGTADPIGQFHVAGSHANGVMADGNDRPSIAATGVYPQIVMMAGESVNASHGPTLMMGSYDNTNSSTGNHKHWSIGTSGYESTFLDFGYHGGTDLNPHAGIRNHNGSTFMTILNSGNVGVGTVSPTQKLEVVGNVMANLYYDRDNAGYYSDPNSTSRMSTALFDNTYGAYNHFTHGGTFVGDWQTLTNTAGQLNYVQVNNITADASHVNEPSGVYSYGGVLSMRGADHSFQLYAAHTGDLAYKTQWGNDNYSGWRRILTTPNAGGTTDRVAKFTSTSSIGNSNITDDGNIVVVSPPTYTHFNTGTVYVENTLVARGPIIDDGGDVTVDDNLHVTGESYYNNWIRHMSTSQSGLYWQEGTGAGWHIYPKDASDMYMRAGSGNGSICGTTGDVTPRGYVHWTTSNEIGFLNAGRGWSLRVDNSNNSFHYGSSRAPIFYDLDDTGYYVDPASYQRLNGGIEMSIYSGHTYVANGQSWGNCHDCCTATINGNCGWWNYWHWADCGTCGRTVHHRMTVNGGIAAYSFWDWSDSKIKSDVSTLTNALSIVKQLRGVSYKLIDPEQDGISNYDKNKDFDRLDNGPQIGFIAQEVQELLPQLVKELNVTDPDDSTKVTTRVGMEYGKMTAVLVEAVKEQQEMIESLEQKIHTLTSALENVTGQKMFGIDSNPEVDQTIESLEKIWSEVDVKAQVTIEGLINKMRKSNKVDPWATEIISRYNSNFNKK
jgi:hypothetical protein